MLIAGVGLAGLLLAGPGTLHAQPGEPPRAAAPDAARQAAKDGAREEADRLLFEGASPEQRARVEAAIREGPGSALGAEVLARIADAKPAPGWALDAAVSACGLWPPTQPAMMAKALAGARTREAMKALLALAARAPVGAARTTCLDALVDLTGREDLGADLAGWNALLTQAEAWTEPTWWRTLAAWQSDRARRRSAEQQQISTRLMETLRQVHLSTPASERSRLLATLLNDQLPEVRRVGIELALRELASAHALGADVASGTIRLLSDPDEPIRASAAGLLLQLAPAGSAEIATAALAREKSPRVAAPLLKLAVRADDPAAVGQAISWLEDPGKGGDRASEAAKACRDAAVELAWQLTRRGIMNDDADRVRVLAALRAIPLAESSPASCQLRGMLGTGWDVEQVATLLTSADAAQRLGAAETVVSRPEHLDGLLAAAKADARLVEVAVRGVALHRQTAAGFIGIERATADKPELRRSALTAVADVLPAPEVLDAIDSLSNEPEMKEAVLSTLARRDRITSERTDAVKARAIADGLLRLARVRLSLDRAAEAVSALDALRLVGVEPDADAAARLRALAFIRLDRVDDALASGADAEAWLEGLAAVLDRPFAPKVLTAIEFSFGATMTEEQFARLEALRRRLPAAPPAAARADDNAVPVEPR